jgi:hypothetical protein
MRSRVAVASGAPVRSGRANIFHEFQIVRGQGLGHRQEPFLWHCSDGVLVSDACVPSEIIPGKSWSVTHLQHAFRLRVITNQVEHNVKTRLTKTRKVA